MHARNSRPALLFVMAAACLALPFAAWRATRATPAAAAATTQPVTVRCAVIGGMMETDFWPTLAGRFAGITREHVAAHGGEVIELRGDEALVVFASARQGIRAALELQAAYVEQRERQQRRQGQRCRRVWIGRRRAFGG